ARRAEVSCRPGHHGVEAEVNSSAVPPKLSYPRGALPAVRWVPRRSSTSAPLPICVLVPSGLSVCVARLRRGMQHSARAYCRTALPARRPPRCLAAVLLGPPPAALPRRRQLWIRVSRIETYLKLPSALGGGRPASGEGSALGGRPASGWGGLGTGEDRPGPQ